MQALVITEGKLKYTTSYPEPTLNVDEVLVAVELAGICSTDLEIVKGYMDFSGVLGHEFVGKVVKGPANIQGRRVVGEINCVCGKCEMCHSGLSNHCTQRTVIGIKGHDGVFADYVSLPRRNVHVIPENLSSEDAVFVEPLAAAFQIVHQAPIEPRAKVIVVGDGRLGLLAVQVLAAAGSKGNVVLVGRHEEKLAFAEKRGIQGILLQDMLIKPQWDIVVDCTGSVEGFTTACRLVRPRGKLVLKSTFVCDQPVDLSPLVINEISLIGSRCGLFPVAIDALAAGQIVVNGMVTARYKLAQGAQAMEKAKDPKQIKVLLEMR